jgi:Rrf2 family transcriptional regulator, cysteine metabolism repressor
MRLSTKCRYGMRAMIEIARHYGRGPLKRKDIARTQGISKAYLENILSALKAMGLIRTLRGKEGGFTLPHPPSSINLLDIFTALEGSLSAVDCVDDTEACAKSDKCLSRLVWKKLQQAQTDVLKSMTLDDVVNQDFAGKQAGSYCI